MTKTITVTGNTYPHRNWLKDEGFRWDGDNWTLVVTEDADGKIECDAFCGTTIDSFANRVRCYTKRQCDITVE